MSTASDEILARYKKRETETDTFGRAITVRLLRPSEQTAVIRMADSESNSVQMPYIVAASVCEIDGDHITPARQQADVGAVMDRLDEEGLAAATKAFLKLRGVTEANGEGSGDAASVAKNSPKTERSDKPAS